MEKQTFGAVEAYAYQDIIPTASEAHSIPIFTNGEGDTIPYQQSTDRLLLASKGMKKVYLSWTEKLPIFQSSTNIHLGKIQGDTTVSLQTEKRPEALIKPVRPMYYQAEGPMWENDVIAFRTYWDQRNGFDIFGKRTSSMILDQVGKEENYHELQSWGMDILKVGNSLGAGAIGIKIGEEVFRLGDTAEEQFRVLHEGPLYSSFELLYKGWQVKDRTYNVSRVISIYKGLSGYISSITVDGLQGDESLVTGMVNLHNKEFFQKTINDQEVLYTFDAQAEMDKYLGMAVSAPATQVVAVGNIEALTSEISDSWYMELRFPKEQQPITYTFWADWELREGGVKDKISFEGLLTTQLEEMP
ncbi:DUF4861 family protein [Algivirga pacifica]|uniref:DUF4861 domain-containing protein n=1 Tax=Algivirga pacifica TaxID=1162670 RepID=A0ABP9D3N6_9BACT